MIYMRGIDATQFLRWVTVHKISLHAVGQDPASTRSALSRRVGAIPIRSQLEVALSGGEDVTLDFDGVEATQSFVDELVGVQGT